MLDRLPPQLRHLALMLLASLLVWAGQDLVPWLRDEPAAAALAAPLVVLLVNVLTPLTRQYGVGSLTRQYGVGSGTVAAGREQGYR